MTPQLRILVVEDNEDDVYFLQRALRQTATSAEVHLVADGQAALDYLRGHGAYADRERHPFPSLIFLDLKLPYVHGLDVLATIRGDAALKHARVCILTSSFEDRDRRRAESLGIEAYLVKPPTREMLLGLLGGNGAAPPPSA